MIPSLHRVVYNSFDINGPLNNFAGNKVSSMCARKKNVCRIQQQKTNRIFRGHATSTAEQA